MRRFDNIDEMLYGAYSDVFAHGERVSPRGQETLEITGWTGQLARPRARIVRNPVRDIRLGYCAANVAWNLAERDDVESICWWNPNGRFISDDGERFYGANYGQRWRDLLTQAIGLLELDEETRRAWVPVWKPEDIHREVIHEVGPATPFNYSAEGKDVPCTLGFALRTRSGMTPTARKLDMHVVMRSQSMSILPYDVFLFSVMQELLANSMGMELGHLTWHCISLHLYFKREYAMNRATYEWYRDNTHLEGVLRAEVYRTFQTEMPPIDMFIGEATHAWPSLMDALSSTDAWLDDEVVDDLDPVSILMIEGARRTWKELNAA